MRQGKFVAVVEMAEVVFVVRANWAALANEMIDLMVMGCLFGSLCSGGLRMVALLVRTREPNAM